jgi:hypothetical protein
MHSTYELFWQLLLATGRHVPYTLKCISSVAAFMAANHFSSMTSKPQPEELIEAWTLPYAATLGSSVRRQGIFLEMRARLSPATRKSLKIDAGSLVLRMAAEDARRFAGAAKLIADALGDIESLPVIPREIEHILQISSTERHRWLKDSRLPSAGTRTVKLRGRARQLTFHVFDPRLVEDVLDRDLVANWREEDAATATENRRRAAWNAKMTRSLKTKSDAGVGPTGTHEEDASPNLLGWEEFARAGLLR